MDLKNIPQVKIDPRGGYKYIVVKVSDEKGRKKLLVRADKRCFMHINILEMVHREIGLSACCIGGGRIAIDPDAKTIRVWGCSGDFDREPDRQLTVKILQDSFPDWTIMASN